ncbi:MAG: hypothetical protein KDE53_16355 [Caldilineaceae bacterium]|nr:hypothetical protein [Caldilineaceae bacterium]MCB0121054.1 hypothetical protein [Caldilineaceae bacterium]
MKKETNNLIQAVVVNHNTSRFVELMLRSLYATHAPTLNLTMTVLDNCSTDEKTELQAYLEQQNISLRQSGFSTETERNSHGEVLSRFVLGHPDCAYYLFLDADVYFLQEGTIDVMLATLNGRADLFGVGAHQSWDGVAEIAVEIHEAIYERRLHPCCALIRNTPTFRRVVEEIGLTGINYCWVAGETYWDTFELMTKVMKTHGLYHALCPNMVYHFFSVSYDERYMERKNRECAMLLAALR